MGARIHARIDADGDAGALAEEARPGGDAFEFGCAFDVDRVDAALDGEVDLRDGLANAGEDDLRRIGARPQHALKLAARDDVEAGSQRGEPSENAQVGVRLHGVADSVVDAVQSLRQPLLALADVRPRIDVRRGAHRARDVRQRHVVGAELAVAVRERHGGSGRAKESAHGASADFEPRRDVRKRLLRRRQRAFLSASGDSRRAEKRQPAQPRELEAATRRAPAFASGWLGLRHALAGGKPGSAGVSPACGRDARVPGIGHPRSVAHHALVLRFNARSHLPPVAEKYSRAPRTSLGDGKAFPWQRRTAKLAPWSNFPQLF